MRRSRLAIPEAGIAAWISAGVGNVVFVVDAVGDAAPLEIEGRGVEVLRGPVNQN